MANQKKITGLHAQSEAYYSKQELYKKFSDAEDARNVIADYLDNNLREYNLVLDAGCGTGKYVDKLSTKDRCVVGVDLSYNQLSGASYCTKELIVNADLINMPFRSNSFTAGYSCWVLGTILDEEKRQLVLDEIFRVIGNGVFLCIENMPGSDFEYLRGRHLNNSTQQYNNWLISNGFLLSHELDIEFEFGSRMQAIQVFQGIWGNRLHSNPKSRIISSKVGVFKRNLHV